MYSKFSKQFNTGLISLMALFVVACGGDDNDGGVAAVIDGSTLSIPSTYAFDSQSMAGESSVSYSGQTFRNILLEELVATINGATSGTTVEDLEVSFDFDSQQLGNAIAFELSSKNDSGLLAMQSVYSDISGSSKDLVGKIAGNDTGVGFIPNPVEGYDGSLTAEAITRDLFEKFEDTVSSDQVITLSDGSTATLSVAYVSADGFDYKQIIQKYLGGAIAYHQGTSDYLQTDWAKNNVFEEGKSYTTAEHKWDEGFGYFGAARDYADYTDDEIAGEATDKTRNIFKDSDPDGVDSDPDGVIDLKSEYNFGYSANCAKRDRGTVGKSVETDYTKQSFDLFLKGRAILNELAKTPGVLTAEQDAVIQDIATEAAQLWELCIAATAVHYINDTVDDLDVAIANGGAFASVDEFEDYAKHWGELYGFSLALQFNVDKLISDADLSTVLSTIGTAPVVPVGETTELQDYKTDLEGLLTTMQAAYGDENGFTTENVTGW